MDRLTVSRLLTTLLSMALLSTGWALPCRQCGAGPATVAQRRADCGAVAPTKAVAYAEPEVAWAGRPPAVGIRVAQAVPVPVPPVAPVTPAAGQKGMPWERAGTAVGQEIVGPDGGKMVWVPAGSLLMGSDEKDAPTDEKPAHLMKLTGGFWLGKYEVTIGQYRAFCQATERRFGSDTSAPPDHPMEGPSWDEAAAYCQHFGLVLPTEAQWEYAARGADGRRYPWGNEWDAKKCCNGANRGTGRVLTLAVGSVEADRSWCGAADMAGNVREWCADWYGDAYYAQSPPEDPKGAGNGEFRVLRGGSVEANGESYFSAWRRGRCRPDMQYFSIGFRCVALPSQPMLDGSDVVVEGESYTSIAQSMARGSDAAASGGAYVGIPLAEPHAAREAATQDTGNCAYTVVISTAGEYRLWARVWWTDSFGNSFYLRPPDKKIIVLGQDSTFQSWHWVRGPSLHLDAGPVTIVVQNREGGTRLDEFLLTTKTDYVPIGPLSETAQNN
ncbi:MAG: SUMF1/EgtB/PvdO family nonheme iron enzyme [Armatimonadia bacterium]